MILHCEFCSLQGEAVGEHSAVAVIDKDKLRLPLDGSMFKSLFPDGGVPDPWLPGTEWRYMFCRRCGNVHTVFMVPDDDVEGMMERGGPKRLLTEEGWINLDGDDNRVVVIEENLAEQPHVHIVPTIICPHCDFVAKSAQGLKVHIGAKHRGG